MIYGPNWSWKDLHILNCWWKDSDVKVFVRICVFCEGLCLRKVWLLASSASVWYTLFRVRFPLAFLIGSTKFIYFEESNQENHRFAVYFPVLDFDDFQGSICTRTNCLTRLAWWIWFSVCFASSHFSVDGGIHLSARCYLWSGTWNTQFFLTLWKSIDPFQKFHCPANFHARRTTWFYGMSPNFGWEFLGCSFGKVSDGWPKLIVSS